MPKYAVHKLGFFWTDDSWGVGEQKGSIVGITSSLEEALGVKQREDIISLRNTAKLGVIDFLPDDNYRETYNKMAVYYKTEFNQIIEYPSHDVYLPEQMTDEQAAGLLKILELSFHNIVEYGDEEVIDVDSFNFDKYEGDVQGF
jgi:hypothetical protein